MVQRGDYFMKRNRFGLGSLRHVAVSGDLTMLYWHHMGNVSKPSAMLLSDVERCVGLALPSVSFHLTLPHLAPLHHPHQNNSVEIVGKRRSILTLHGKPGRRSLSFEYVSGSRHEETAAVVNLWLAALGRVLAHWSSADDEHRGRESSLDAPISPGTLSALSHREKTRGILALGSSSVAK
jgi:hypothetical protein